MTMPDRQCRDRGETLVEILVAIGILGTAGVAVMGGLALAVKSSDLHRKDATSGAYVRSFAEAIQNYVEGGHYQSCAAANAYTVPAVTNQLTNLPGNYTVSQDAANSVGPTGAAAAGCTSDTGLQQVTLHVKSNDGRADQSLVIVLRRPCDTSTLC